MGSKSNQSGHGTGHSNGTRSSQPSWTAKLHISIDPQVDAAAYHRKTNHLGSGERLQYVCLIDAIQNLHSNNPEDRQEARDWVNSDREDHVFSFLQCCETFDLDPSSVREALERTKWDPVVKRLRLYAL